MMMDACHSTLSTPTECTTPRVNDNVNYGLWVMMMCLRRFINRNECLIPVGMLMIGEVVHVRRQEINGNLCLSLLLLLGT